MRCAPAGGADGVLRAWAGWNDGMKARKAFAIRYDRGGLSGSEAGAPFSKTATRGAEEACPPQRNVSAYKARREIQPCAAQSGRPSGGAAPSPLNTWLRPKADWGWALAASDAWLKPCPRMAAMSVRQRITCASLGRIRRIVAISSLSHDFRDEIWRSSGRERQHRRCKIRTKQLIQIEKHATIVPALLFSFAIPSFGYFHFGPLVAFLFLLGYFGSILLTDTGTCESALRCHPVWRLADQSPVVTY